MTAARLREGRMVGMSRIVEHCEALARVTDDQSSDARTRLESVLGPELAHRLVARSAAAAGGPSRSSSRPAPADYRRRSSSLP